MQPMDERIQYVIKLFYYPMWFIKLNKQVTCPCVNHNTKQSEPGCPLCLGTGYKIKLIRAKAARQTTENSAFRGEGIGFSEKNATDRFFTLDNLELKEDDIIIDNGNVNIVQYYMPGRTNASHPVYYRTIASRKKVDVDVFLRAFYNLLAKKGYKP